MRQNLYRNYIINENQHEKKTTHETEKKLQEINLEKYVCR